MPSGGGIHAINRADQHAEGVAIRCDRMAASVDVVDAWIDLFILRGPPEYIRSPLSLIVCNQLPGNG